MHDAAVHDDEQGEDRLRRGILRVPGEGELLTVPGVEHLFLLTGADTAGAVAFEEFALAPGVVGACLYTPAGYEEYHREVSAAAAAGTELDDDVLAVFRSRHATRSHDQAGRGA